MHCITFSSKNQTGPPKAWVSINPATQTNKTNNLLHPPGLLRAVAYGGVHLLSKLPEVASVELKRMTPRFELLSRHSTTTKKSTISATPTFLITHTLHGTGIYAAPWTPPGRFSAVRPGSPRSHLLELEARGRRSKASRIAPDVLVT